MIYDRGDVVILPFPFITADEVQQKARLALIVSDHSIQRRFNDVILAGITSQRIDDIKQTEFIIEEGTDEFIRSGLGL
jgi:mRNA-degrading endonuclease toxin of MazEF toxin-antitoxin module